MAMESGQLNSAAHRKRIEIRWRDLDGYGHVNNAVYLTYIEEVQDEWLARTLEGRGDPSHFVTARIAIDYRRELRLDDDEVVAACALARIGTASLTTRLEIRTSNGALAAEAEAVLVARDPETGRSRPLTADERSALQGQMAVGSSNT
jgi:acyl-CoA thioester hydrolase